MNLTEILTTLTIEHGREILKNQWQVMGLIADRYSMSERDKHLLEIIYKAGVINDLMHDGGTQTQLDLSQKLKNVEGVRNFV